MSLGKFLKKAVPIAAAVVGNTILPGAGAAIGAGLGRAATGGNLSSSLKSAGMAYLGSNILGSVAGTPLSGGLQGATQGSGLLGGLTGGSWSLGSTGLGSLLGGSSGGISGGGLLSNLYSGYSGLGALKSAKSAQTGALSPYASTGVGANAQLAKMLGLDEDADEEEIQRTLEATPGYQFQQQQGEQALNRSLGAKGKVFSGEALKEASAYNSGLASQYYKDYLNQLQNQSAQGFGASGALGDVGANYAMGKYGLLSNVASNILNPVRYY